MKPISVIVITLNEEKRISNLLKDLSAQTYHNFEVVVVDSNSDAATLEIAETFKDSLPSLKTHNMGERGVSLGRNTGASLATHNRLLFLDADVRLRPSFLQNAMEKLEQTKLEVAGVYMGSKGLPVEHKAGYALFNAGLFTTQFYLSNRGRLLASSPPSAPTTT
jgi:glycosyltransferase involved in cell wall biosynthesis